MLHCIRMTALDAEMELGEVRKGTNTPEEDEDGLVLPNNHSKWLFRTSWLFMGTAMYGWTRPIHDLALWTSVACATSVNYWRHPVHGPRRWVDISIVSSGIAYHVYRACYSDVGWVFGTMSGIGCSMYGLSHLVYRKNLGLSTGLHMASHLIANATAFWLYTNDSVPSVRFWS